MNKPQYVVGIVCPICDTKDTTSLVQVDSGILWCENGHVVRIAGELVHEIVHEFKLVYNFE
jgi:Zn ribbon nucleic-acid-binding protein